MKNTLKLLTLCTAFNLWAVQQQEMKNIHVGQEGQFTTNTIGGSTSQSVSPTISVTNPEALLATPQNQTKNVYANLDELANEVINMKTWKANDSKEMIRLMTPEGQEYPKIGNFFNRSYLQEMKDLEGTLGLLVLRDEREIARAALTVTLILGIASAAAGVALSIVYLAPILAATASIGSIVGGGVGPIGALLAKIFCSDCDEGEKKVEISYWKKVIKDQLRIVDDSNIKKITFFRDYPACKIFYRQFANKTIAKNLKNLMEKLHKNSHKSLISSSTEGANLLENQPTEAQEIKINVLKEEKGKLTEKVENKTTEINVLKEQNGKLTKQVEDKTTEIKNLKSEVTSLSQQVNSQSEQIKDLMEKNNTLASKNHRFSKTIDRLTGLSESQAIQIGELRAQNRILDGQIEAQATEIQGLRSDFTRIEETMEARMMQMMQQMMANNNRQAN